METLVICIDRDDDLGEKAQIQGPVIGRENNVQAAVALSIADPADSDSNTIFGGIKALDELLESGIEAQMVTLVGDKKVGLTSDRKIAQQLEEVLEKLHAKNAVIITDGAEDESLIPIVQSRIKINSVKRIVVLQSENLESTYYVLKHAFNDPKISQTFFVPLGLAALIYSIFLLAHYPEGAIIGILAAVGIYLLYRGFGESFDRLLENVKNVLNTGKLTAITHTAALLVILIALIQGSAKVWQYYSIGGLWYTGLIPLLTVFIHTAIWWLVLASVLINFGRIVDQHGKGKFNLTLLDKSLYSVSMGLLFWGATTYILAFNPTDNMEFISISFALQLFVLCIVASIIIALVGIKLSVERDKKQ